MKNLRGKLDKIASWRSKFHLKEETASHQLNEITNRQTFSEVDDKRIRGRAKEKEVIMRMLLDMNFEEDIAFIPIVGLGGLGKTTLAQLVYNDQRVKKAFALKAWVYVSMEFDLKRIGEAITSQQIKPDRCDFNDLQSVRNSLERVLNDKRCLIVLDDLWNEDVDKLNDLKLMLKGGSKGSKIVITTRSQKIAMHMGSGFLHKLELLSNDDCWYLVKERVLGNGNNESNPIPEETKREIAKKCNGVPLAANSLGSILLLLGGLDAWNSDTWELNENDGYPTESKIMKSLLLSYYHMPAPLKLCFAYCAIFPKGCEIDKEQLIQQWVVLDFIKPTNGCSALDKIAEEYVNDLLWMSFLQYSPLEDKKRVLCMHDLVHDLARSVARDEVHIVDARKGTPTVSRDCRYISMINFRDSLAISKVVPKRARSLHFKDCTLLKVPNKVLSSRKYLRVINLSGCCNENIDPSVIELKHLSYLDASHLPIITLSIPRGSANKIQYLNLHGCSKLNMLPESIGNLESLQYLDLSCCTNLQGLPETIGNLVKLQFLDLSSNHELRKLPISISRLKELRHLNLSDCHNLQILPDFVGNLRKVQILDVSWCLSLLRLTESIIKLTDLQYLDISNCGHIKLLPELLGNLYKLKSLNLSGCNEIDILPESIINLNNLLRLYLCDCRGLQILPESLGNLCKLQLLDLSNCSELHTLPKSLGNLMNLEQLNLSCCHKLKELPNTIGNLYKLRYLNLSSCYDLRVLPESFNNLVNLENLDLSYCCSLNELPQLVDNNDKLEKLDLLGCTSLKQSKKGIEKFVNTNMSGSGIVQKLPQLFKCREIEGDNGMTCSIVQLGNLDQTEGIIQITHLENVHMPEDGEEAKLCEKKRLRSLTLEWTTYPTRDTESTMMDEIILDKLKPHQNLELLIIDGYSANKFPSWTMGLVSSLPNLIQIQLCNLAKCEQLPSFEKLPNLEVLVVQNVPNLKKVNKDASGGKVSFRKLRVLVLEDLPNLMEWRTSLLLKHDGPMFPKLQKVEIKKCPKLQFQPFLPDGANFVIIESSKLLGSPESKVPLRSRTSWLYIENCDSYLKWSLLSYLVNVEYLEISMCNELITLPEGVRALKSLKYLCISSCINLAILPEWLDRLSTLRMLWVRDCIHLADATIIKKEDDNQSVKISAGMYLHKIYLIYSI
jgi:Leucine-rich repeat (LRR) protein